MKPSGRSDLPVAIFSGNV